MDEHIKQVQQEFQNEHDFKEDFEDLQKPRYIASFIVYASFGLQILTTIIVLILLILFNSNTNFVYTATPVENALTIASSDVNAIVAVSNDAWAEYEKSFDRMLYKVYDHQDGYVLLINSYSEVYLSSDFTKVGDDYLLKEEAFIGIFDGSLTKWANQATIDVYIPMDDVPAFATNYVLINASSLVNSQDGMTTPIFESMVNLICYLAMIIPMVLILRPSLKFDLDLFKKIPASDTFSKVGMGILYVIAAGFAANFLAIIINLMLNTPNQISMNQLSINKMLFLNPLAAGLMIFAAVFIGPVVEELAFRKSIFGFIRNQKTALIVSSVLFGAIHIVGELITLDFIGALTSGISYIAAGFVFGYIYTNANKNIYIPILTHIGYNAVSVILTYLNI